MVRHILLLLFWVVPVWAATDPEYSGADVPWTHLEFLATRFPFSALSSVDLALVKPADVLLRKPGEGTAIAPGPAIVRLGYRADLFGQKFETSLWMQAGTGAALQYDTVESGRRQRHRTLRFTDRGVALWTVRPTSSEEGRPLAAWTDQSSGFRPYEPAVSELSPELAGLPVVDPLGLLYVVAAADFGPRRASLELLGLSGRQLIRISLLAKPVTVLSADYTVRQGKKDERCRGKFRVVPVEIRPESLTSEEADLDFLGLSSDIEVLIAEKTRLPLRITGRARRLGNVSIRLRSAVLPDGVACG